MDITQTTVPGAAELERRVAEPARGIPPPERPL